MSCNTSQTKCNCGCSGSLSNPALWSKKKKLEVLENNLECLEKQTKEIEESIKELKS